MDERILRAATGFWLVFQHVVVFVYVGALTALDRFTTDEMSVTFVVIAPLFVASATAAARRLFRQEEQEASAPIAWEKASLGLTMPIVVFAVVMLVISWKAFGSLSFYPFVILVGSIETLIGFYVGMIVEKLFGPEVS